MKAIDYKQTKVTAPSLTGRAGGESVILILLFLLISCTPSLPDHYEEATWQMPPDYFSPNNFGATLPPNIAPLR